MAEINAIDQVVAECAREIAAQDTGSDFAALIRIIDAQAAEIERLKADLTSKRQAVRLTGEEIDAVAAEVDCIEVHTDGATEFARAIESAVLAANGLGDAK